MPDETPRPSLLRRLLHLLLQLATHVAQLFAQRRTRRLRPGGIRGLHARRLGSEPGLRFELGLRPGPLERLFLALTILLHRGADAPHPEEDHQQDDGQRALDIRHQPSLSLSGGFAMDLRICVSLWMLRYFM